MSTARIGTTEYLKQSGGISTTLRNRLEKDGVIHPQRTGKWRTYSSADVTATKRWLAQQGRRIRR